MAAPALDPYEVLGVRRGATKDQIRTAYREQVARYHPDKHRGNPLEELAAQKLVEINQAYAMLTDDTKPAAYQGAARRASDSAEPPAAAATSPLPQPLMKWVQSIGLILSLLFFIRFGIGFAYRLLLIVRGVLVWLISLMRMGPIFAIVIVVLLTMGGSWILRARKKS